MRKAIWLLGAALVLGGCGTRTVNGAPVPGGRDGGVVVVGDEDARSRDGGGVFGRSVNVPRGHYPPPGECRIWFPAREPGHQPPPARCEALVGRVPLGAFLLYNERAWDTEHDWRGEVRRGGVSVPEIVLRIMDSVVRR